MKGDYSYNPLGKRDPFRSFLSISTETTNTEIIPRTPLQKYELEQYRLTAIIWDMDPPMAMVEDPLGIGHPVVEGDYIGKNWGKVIQPEKSTLLMS